MICLQCTYRGLKGKWFQVMKLHFNISTWIHCGAGSKLILQLPPEQSCLQFLPVLISWPELWSMYTDCSDLSVHYLTSWPELYLTIWPELWSKYIHRLLWPDCTLLNQLTWTVIKVHIYTDCSDMIVHYLTVVKVHIYTDCSDMIVHYLTVIKVYTQIALTWLHTIKPADLNCDQSTYIYRLLWPDCTLFNQLTWTVIKVHSQTALTWLQTI